MFKLFDVAKVGCYCESITHTTEKRKDGESKVIRLSLRIDPFDVKLATALSPAARQTLFKMNNGDAQEHLRKVHFALGVPRQRMEMFATTDTNKGSILLDHVRIGDIYARTSNDKRDYVLVLRAIFGPPSARELEFVEFWRNSMSFVTFTEAEHDEAFDFQKTDEDAEDEEEDAQPALPVHEFETEPGGKPVDAAPSAREREKEHARHAKPRHADRKAAAKAKQKGRGRR